MSWDIVGQEWLVERLRHDLRADRLRHAYLFVGPAGVGKHTLAREFARALVCEAEAPPCGQCRACQLTAKGVHPDLLIITPEISGKKVRTEKIKIEPVRELIYSLALKPVEARRRVALLVDFDAANDQTMNALLKTLEEPPGQAILLLTALNTEALLPTIVSRCEVVELRPAPVKAVETALITRWLVPAERAEQLARLSGGRLGWAVRLHEDPEAWEERRQRLDDLERLLRATRVERFAYADRLARDATSDRLQTVLELWGGYWRDVLLTSANAAAALTHSDYTATIQQTAQRLPPAQVSALLAALLETRGRLERNINARLALEILLLDWPYL